MTNRTEYQQTMEERLATAGATLDRIATTAKGYGGAVRDELQEIVDQLRAERETLSKKLEELRALDDDAWEDYRQTTERAQKRFEADLAIADAEFERRQAETRQQFADTVDDELEAWRVRLEELRLHAGLARMDARDEFEPVLRALHRRRSELEHRLKDLRDASEGTWTSVREDISDRLQQLRRSLRDADEQLPD